MDFGNSLDRYLGLELGLGREVIPYHYVVEYTADSDLLQARWRATGKVDDEFIGQLRKLPPYKGLVYRGVVREFILRYSAALSTSKDLRVAKRFASLKDGSVLGVYYGYEGYDISKISEFPAEQEVLCLMPKGQEDDAFHVLEHDGMLLYMFAPPEHREEALKLLEKQIE